MRTARKPTPSEQQRSPYHPQLEAVLWTLGQAVPVTLAALDALPGGVRVVLTCAAAGHAGRWCLVTANTVAPDVPVTVRVVPAGASGSYTLASVEVPGPVLVCAVRHGAAQPLTVEDVLWWLTHSRVDPDGTWHVDVPVDLIDSAAWVAQVET